ncbi:hypothetical protein NPIL_206501 [Nephila pilipes]|uniref:Uncharacterized protein n=1 Tax=Nephila pilipes TaxID=299642 RepID=A0A8X6UG79_NEPPI|nr:hypothetical protein NPIL_206501 [Nephila pilipes]
MEFFYRPFGKKYRNPKLYMMAHEAWEFLGRQAMAPWIKLTQMVGIPFTGTNGPSPFLKRRTIVPSVCRRCTGSRKLYADSYSISNV